MTFFKDSPESMAYRVDNINKYKHNGENNQCENNGYADKIGIPYEA